MHSRMLFFTDLDNTIIYSYKHDIGADKIDVELYQGRNISFVSEKTHKLLLEVRDRMPVIPVTTRTLEQYKRIDLRVGSFKYALVCNGGLLLRNGESVESWYRDSLELIGESKMVLDKALELLKNDPRRVFELRFIEKLFVFTKCNEPEQVVRDLRNRLDTDLADVFNNGTKVYVVPRKLNKGQAVKRFTKWIYENYRYDKSDSADEWQRFGNNDDSLCTIAAGDSEFDITMLEAVKCGLAPSGFAKEYGVEFGIEEMPEKELFSEAVLSRCLQIYAASVL